jgi:GNAT superfamily N-acetyltransferase
MWMEQMGSIRITPFNEGLELAVSELIRKVYDEFVAPDYSAEGNRFFYDWIEPLKIRARQMTGRNMFVAMEGESVIGVIEIRDNNRISLLFTDKDYQGIGIARSLFQESLKQCIQREPSLSKFYVHASPFSVSIYKRLGFIAVDEMQEQNGLKYVPMEMNL